MCCFSVKPEYSELLKTHFPDDRQTILAMAYCRLTRQSSLKMMDYHFSGSYMSEILTDAKLSGDSLTKHIRKIGIKREAIVGFCREFKAQNDNIIFDGTDLLSESGKLAELYVKLLLIDYPDQFRAIELSVVHLECEVILLAEVFLVGDFYWFFENPTCLVGASAPSLIYTLLQRGEFYHTGRFEYIKCLAFLDDYPAVGPWEHCSELYHIRLPGVRDPETPEEDSPVGDW